MKGKTIARTGDFTGVLGISKNQERNLLSRLAQSGFIIRLRRGVYLLPEKIPSGGSYNPGTAYILDKLFEDLEGRYQLCGPACFNFYGFGKCSRVFFKAFREPIDGYRRPVQTRVQQTSLSTLRYGMETSRQLDV